MSETGRAGTSLRASIACSGARSALARALGRDLKGRISIALYLVAIPAAFWARPVAIALYLVVVLAWIVPDRRIEAMLRG
ncbi:hypothetical protein MTR62_12830 [Novosphingobium sp. 1949]|uniref:PspC domain-containing protein n=1 Tax=Novosphingobium organovorum TaxID=2930092 RepID=A0ABT0BET3_9SPHN|nr:hypothetical protein [Novosphingobium organovorum]MCJ2183568.1 hypothetical protein [Novosphingobium organovorum]